MLEQERERGPVREIPGDAGREPEAGTGLCLSGGGYRAMLFHTGSLWRLNEAGMLPNLARISSVSGGSITAGVLGMNWERLEFVDGVAQRFAERVVQPVRALASQSIDVSSVVVGALTPRRSASDRIVTAYRKFLFGNATLQDLPNYPRFVINATNVQSKALWRFSKPYCRDYRVGKIPNPKLELALAVGASSAFPPFLSPVELRFEESDYVPNTGMDLQRPPYTTRVVLTDGGVYDNLGLETAWKRNWTILVSDAGGQASDEERPSTDWARHTHRILEVIDHQVRSLRKRLLIDAYIRDRRPGAYWSIRSEIANYGLGDGALDCPQEKVDEIADVPTRLQKLPARMQERLINWGYAMTDAALRRHVDRTLPKGKFPYAGGVG